MSRQDGKVLVGLWGKEPRADMPSCGGGIGSNGVPLVKSPPQQVRIESWGRWQEEGGCPILAVLLYFVPVGAAASRQLYERVPMVFDAVLYMAPSNAEGAVLSLSGG